MERHLQRRFSIAKRRFQITLSEIRKNEEETIGFIQSVDVGIVKKLGLIDSARRDVFQRIQKELNDLKKGPSLLPVQRVMVKFGFIGKLPL